MTLYEGIREGWGTNPLADMSNNTDNRNRALKDDNRLVSLCLKGDVNAFEVLVERYQKRMLNIAFRMTGDYEEACDIVQDAFLAAYRSIKKFRGDSVFSTWLTAITINHTKNRLKQMRTRRYHEVISIDDPQDNQDDRIAFEPQYIGPTAVEQLETKDIQAKVQECINALDEEYKAVLVLRDIQEFSYDEIRDILKIPDGTVKSRLFRARDAIKNCLKKILEVL
ncbi:MAG: RNA polymerase subunit sigma-24 [Syntrophus sp. (in: bacteria)]|nr:RNA polymerase subunit sigma-24 [Syntrophus sp. (in: bacteria)]